MELDTLEYTNDEVARAVTDSITCHVPQTLMQSVVDSVAEVHHDTLKLPNLFENFFSMSSNFWHGDLSVSGLGETGVLIPYTTVGDDFINISMFLCITLTAISWMLSKQFVAYQFYNILHAPREGSMRQRESIHQVKYLNYFVLQWAFLAAVLIYTLEEHALNLSFLVPSWTTVGILMGVILLCTIVTDILRKIPHSVYFDTQQRKLYNTERATYQAYYGMLVLPFALLSVYITDDIILLCEILLGCLVFVKIIEISKVYSIFFRKNGSFLHFFLYLCTLEAVPILLMVGILTFTTLALSSKL